MELIHSFKQIYIGHLLCDRYDLGTRHMMVTAGKDLFLVLKKEIYS